MYIICVFCVVTQGGYFFHTQPTAIYGKLFLAWRELALNGSILWGQQWGSNISCWLHSPIDHSAHEQVYAGVIHELVIHETFQPQPLTCPVPVNITTSAWPLQFCWTLCSSNRAPGSVCRLSRPGWPLMPSKQFMLGSNREISSDKDAITGWQMWRGAEWAAFVQIDPGWTCWDYFWLEINSNWWFICSSETNQVHPWTPSPISLSLFSSSSGKKT